MSRHVVYTAIAVVTALGGREPQLEGSLRPMFLPHE